MNIFIHGVKNMYKISAKEEMQTLIKQCIQKGTSANIREALQIYKKTFGIDDFVNTYDYYAHFDFPLISLICLDNSNETLEFFLQNQYYSNIEIVTLSQYDTYEDIINYIFSTSSEYLCFFEKGHFYDNSKIIELINCFNSYPSINVAISPRNFIDSNKIILGLSTSDYSSILKDTVFDGKTFLEHNINENINLYGNLSTIMVSTKYAQSLSIIVPTYSSEEINRISLLYQFLLSAKIAFTNTPLVSTILTPNTDTTTIETDYKGLINTFIDKNIVTITNKLSDPKNTTYCIKKKITFFYTDKGEYYNLKPIADEANKRGYQIKFTENIKEPAEIGVYCQHICYPENSKFSIILLHDMAQGHNRWPNIWEIEHWDKFDIGIVPGKFWANLWTDCAFLPYANPRCGVFEFGYPKGDLINSNLLKESSNSLRNHLKLKYNISILYAPSWENNEKEDDFVRALASLPVNLLIKQAHWPKSYQPIIDNISQMRKLHEGNYENVYYIEPEESIMTALELCDLVVSDESSVMTEALLFNKPSIAITDWLIPDTTPSRFASVPMDYVIKIKKVELREYVEKFLTHSDEYETILTRGKSFFSNQGLCCKNIIDAIQFYTEGSGNKEFLSKKLSSKYNPCSMWD